MTLHHLLTKHAHELPCIRWIHFDPYSECADAVMQFDNITFATRPLLTSAHAQPQLCPAHTYVDDPEDVLLRLFSIVAWDHVSWPSNDFYGGARANDDGVKAVATNSIEVVTGVGGAYDPQTNCYLPPHPFETWESVVANKNLTLRVQGNVSVGGVF
jgi:hypothetical protein